MAEDVKQSQKFHNQFMETVGFRKSTNNIECDVIKEQPIRFQSIETDEFVNSNKMYKKSPKTPGDDGKYLNNDKQIPEKRNTWTQPGQGNDPEEGVSLQYESKADDVCKPADSVSATEKVFTEGDSKLQKITAEETTNPENDAIANIKITRIETLQIIDPPRRNNKNIIEDVPETTNAMRFESGNDKFHKGDNLKNIKHKKDISDRIDEEEYAAIKIEDDEVTYYPKPVPNLLQRIGKHNVESLPPAAVNNPNQPDSRRVEVVKVPSEFISGRSNIISEVPEVQAMRNLPLNRLVKDIVPKTVESNENRHNEHKCKTEVTAKGEILKIQEVKLSSNDNDMCGIRSEVPSTQEMRTVFYNKAIPKDATDGFVENVNQREQEYLKDKDNNEIESDNKKYTEIVKEANTILDEMATSDASSDIDKIFNELYEEDSFTEGAQKFDEQLGDSTVNDELESMDDTYIHAYDDSTDKLQSVDITAKPNKIDLMAPKNAEKDLSKMQGRQDHSQNIRPSPLQTTSTATLKDANKEILGVHIGPNVSKTPTISNLNNQTPPPRRSDNVVELKKLDDKRGTDKPDTVLINTESNQEGCMAQNNAPNAEKNIKKTHGKQDHLQNIRPIIPLDTTSTSVPKGDNKEILELPIGPNSSKTPKTPNLDNQCPPLRSSDNIDELKKLDDRSCADKPKTDNIINEPNLVDFIPTKNAPNAEKNFNKMHGQQDYLQNVQTTIPLHTTSTSVPKDDKKEILELPIGPNSSKTPKSPNLNDQNPPPRSSDNDDKLKKLDDRSCADKPKTVNIIDEPNLVDFMPPNNTPNAEKDLTKTHAKQDHLQNIGPTIPRDITSTSVPKDDKKEILEIPIGPNSSKTPKSPNLNDHNPPPRSSDNDDKLKKLDDRSCADKPKTVNIINEPNLVDFIPPNNTPNAEKDLTKTHAKQDHLQNIGPTIPRDTTSTSVPKDDNKEILGVPVGPNSSKTPKSPNFIIQSPPPRSSDNVDELKKMDDISCADNPETVNIINEPNLVDFIPPNNAPNAEKDLTKTHGKQDHLQNIGPTIPRDTTSTSVPKDDNKDILELPIGPNSSKTPKSPNLNDHNPPPRSSDNDDKLKKLDDRSCADKPKTVNIINEPNLVDFIPPNNTPNAEKDLNKTHAKQDHLQNIGPTIPRDTTSTSVPKDDNKEILGVPVGPNSSKTPKSPNFNIQSPPPRSSDNVDELKKMDDISCADNPETVNIINEPNLVDFIPPNNAPNAEKDLTKTHGKQDHLQNIGPTIPRDTTSTSVPKDDNKDILELPIRPNSSKTPKSSNLNDQNAPPRSSDNVDKLKKLDDRSCADKPKTVNIINEPNLVDFIPPNNAPNAGKDLTKTHAKQDHLQNIGPTIPRDTTSTSVPKDNNKEILGFPVGPNSSKTPKSPNLHDQSLPPRSSDNVDELKRVDAKSGTDKLETVLINAESNQEDCMALNNAPNAEKNINKTHGKQDHLQNIRPTIPLDTISTSVPKGDNKEILELPIGPNSSKTPKTPNLDNQNPPLRSSDNIEELKKLDDRSCADKPKTVHIINEPYLVGFIPPKNAPNTEKDLTKTHGKQDHLQNFGPTIPLHTTSTSVPKDDHKDILGVPIGPNSSKATKTSNLNNQSPPPRRSDKVDELKKLEAKSGTVKSATVQISTKTNQEDLMALNNRPNADKDLNKTTGKQDHLQNIPPTIPLQTTSTAIPKDENQEKLEVHVGPNVITPNLNNRNPPLRSSDNVDGFKTIDDKSGTDRPKPIKEDLKGEMNANKSINDFKTSDNENYHLQNIRVTIPNQSINSNMPKEKNREVKNNIGPNIPKSQITPNLNNQCSTTESSLSDGSPCVEPSKHGNTGEDPGRDIEIGNRTVTKLKLKEDVNLRDNENPIPKKNIGMNVPNSNIDQNNGNLHDTTTDGNFNTTKNIVVEETVNDGVLTKSSDNNEYLTKNKLQPDDIKRKEIVDETPSIKNSIEVVMKELSKPDKPGKLYESIKGDESITKQTAITELKTDVTADRNDIKDAKATESIEEKEEFSNDIYTPVITVTKEEIVFTSPTSKLQKITVMEKLENKRDEGNSKTVSKEKKIERIKLVEGPLIMDQGTVKGTIMQSDSLPSRIRIAEEVPKEKKQPLKSEIPRLLRDEHRPKIVDEVTKKTIKKESKESRFPKKASAESKSIDAKTKAPRADVTNNPKDLGQINKQSTESKQAFQGKVKSVMSSLEKKRRNKPIKDPSVKNQEEISLGTKVNNHRMNEEKPKEKHTHLKENEMDRKVVTDINADETNDPPKRKIRSKVKEMIKNIGKRDKTNKDLKQSDLENGGSVLKKDISFEPSKNINKEVTKIDHNRELQTVGEAGDAKIMQEEYSKYVHREDIKLKGKNQHFLKQTESHVSGVNNDSDKHKVPIKNISDENDVPKVTVRSKVKEMLRKIENKIQGTQKEQNKNDETPTVTHVTIVVDTNGQLDHTETTKEGFVPKGKVNHILRSMQHINTLNGDDEMAHKDKSHKEIDGGKKFLRSKSVSDTVAMFESNNLTPNRTFSQTKKEKVKVELIKYKKPFDEEFNKADGKESKESGPDLAKELEKKSKLEEYEQAKHKFGHLEVLSTITLSNGQKMPAIIMGTDSMDIEEVSAIVKAGIDLGYRAIDCSHSSGNEQSVGRAIREKIESGVVTRKDLFITSKLWNTFHRPDLVEQACRNSLDELGLDYLDLYLIHTPMAFKEGQLLLPKIANVLQYSQADYLHTWYAMEQLVRKRLVRHVGVANFNCEQLARIVSKAKLKVTVNQVECHPYLSQHRLGQYCESEGIVVAACGAPAARRGDAGLLGEPELAALARKYGKTPAQVLVRYQLERGRAAVVEPRSARALWDELSAATFALDPRDVDALDGLNKNRRYVTFEGMGDTHKDYPFKTPF